MPQLPGRQFTTADGRTVTLRRPSGSRHEGRTPAGSSFAIVTERDEYGRGSSHAIWGVGPNGRHGTLERNVSATEVIPAIRRWEELGWTRIAAATEAF